MAKDEKGSEKDEKSKEKSEKGDGKWRRDPLAGIFFGMFLIAIGGIYMVRQYLPDPDMWWAWVLLAIGALFFIDALFHSMKPEWKRPILGKIFAGVIFVVIGIGSLMGIEEWWPLILIALGVVMLIYYMSRAYKA